MKHFFKIIKYTGLWFLAAFLVYSCKTDEFKFGELSINKEWTMEIISPMLKGEMEFKDLIYNWEDTIYFNPDDTLTVLKYPTKKFKTIPQQLIFEPSTIIDSFSFLIQGKYEFLQVELKYTVSNGSPFPLNFEMQFFEKTKPLIIGPPILPAAFDSGNFNGTTLSPVSSIQRISLNEEQLKSFSVGNRLKVTTWFNRTDFINTHDTLNSNYPIDISIVMIGKVKAKDE